MMAFEKKEIVSATQLVRQFSNFLTELTNRKLNKIAIIRNNEMQAVVLPIDEYENLVLRADAASQKSLKDFFGSIDKDSATQMEAAVAECRKVDENEW
jgi:PHD/YefM family antitoxin component YafN of YafNO toxin-antitoxin module